MQKRCNYRDIATAADCCVATVSLAMRNHPSLPARTRKRIQELAEKMGYRPNARVSELMGVIRKNRSITQMTEGAALFWSDATRSQVRSYAHLCQLEEAAKARCRQAGFDLDCYYQESGADAGARATERVLQARGVRGVILAPLIHQAQRELNWTWENFAVVIAGSGQWQPEFHRVRFSHFEDIGMIVHQLLQRGRRRIALVVDSRVDDRSQHAMTGGFWGVVPAEVRRSEAVFASDGKDRKAFLRWVEEQQPETLIVGSSEAIVWLTARKQPLELVVMSRELAPEAGSYSGVQQDYAGLGEAAAEQMLGLLSFNQTGIPVNPLRIYLRGRWVEARVPRGGDGGSSPRRASV
jgi:LacI family transcriptional regulator